MSLTGWPLQTYYLHSKSQFYLVMVYNYVWSKFNVDISDYRSDDEAIICISLLMLCCSSFQIRTEKSLCFSTV